MKTYEPEAIRNVGFVAHGGAGKTSIAEAMLFNAGATTRLCKVDEGNSNFDIDPEEIERGGSISTGLFSIDWKKRKLNLVDTPGDSNFIADLRNCIQVTDGVVLVVSAVDGVQVGTERVWSLASDLSVPRAVFVNKMDRERASFENTLEDIQNTLGIAVAPVTIPLGAEGSLEGVVDVLRRKACVYETDGSGKFTEQEVPGDLSDTVEQYHSQLVEAVAETSEELMEKYFEEGLTDEEILQGLATGMASGTIVPLLAGSAVKNVGVKQLMDFIAASFPNPMVRGHVTGFSGPGGEPAEQACDPNGPLVAFVFKTVVDPYAGKLTIFRIFSGKVDPDGELYNANLEEKERYGPILQVMGKKQESLSCAVTGEIAAVTKLKITNTGHTFSNDKQPFVRETLEPIRPCISFAIKPKSQGDEDKVSTALQRMMEEDTSIHLSRDEQSKDFLLSGMGQVHIETTVKKLKRKFGVEVELYIPKVPYKETISRKVTNVEGKHKKQTGGRGQFGVAFIDLEPNREGNTFTYEFVDNIVGGAIPRQFIPAVEKGIVEAMQRGILAGCPVVGVKVRLFDGKYHPVDSSEIAFKIAGSLAFKNAAEKAAPVLLEPIMKMVVVVPEEFMGDVIGDLNSRRGKVLGMEAQGKYQVIQAQVPMAEVLQYSPNLSSMTQDRGSFTMEFSHYEELPPQFADKVIEAAKAEKEAK